MAYITVALAQLVLLSLQQRHKRKHYLTINIADIPQ